MAEGPGFEPRLTQSGSAVLPLNQKPWERNVLMPTKWHCPAPETPMSPATVDREISRFPRKERLHMPGSLTTPGRPGACAIAPECVAFHHMHGVDTQNRKLSRLKGWPMRTPVNASPRQSRATAHDSGPMWIATPTSSAALTASGRGLAWKRSELRQAAGSCFKLANGRLESCGMSSPT